MNDNARRPDGRPEPPAGETQQAVRGEVIGRTDALREQSLAVDLAQLDLNQAIATAHKFPRQLDVVLRKVEQMALYDEAAAERCIYMLPRAGKAIVGPSIGFAHILASAWGNCRDRGEWLRTDRQEKVVVCEGIFMDLETNRTTYAPAVRRIVDSRSQLYSQDMITVTAQAGASIGRRNAILNAVPQTLWRGIYEKALVVVRGTMETLGERRGKLVAAFAGFGIEAKRVFQALGVKGESEITLDHIVMLRGMFEALRDGNVTPEEMFNPRAMINAQFDTVHNPLGGDAGDADEGDETAGMGQAGAQQTPRGHSAGSSPAPARETVDAKTGEVTTANEGPKPQTTPVADGAKPKGKPGRKSNAEKARLAAEAEAAKTGQQPRPAAAPAANAPAPAQQTASATPAPAATLAPAQAHAAASPAGHEPSNAAEYEAHLKIWLAACTSGPEAEDRWRRKDERDLRGKCSIIEDDFDRMKRLKDDRVAALKG